MLRFVKKLGRTDELLSLALILSLVRIDPDSYLGINSHWNGSFIQEHISGDSWGYTQTDFHRRILPHVPDIPHLLSKSPEVHLAQYQEDLIADLNELGRYGSPILNNRVQTYATYLLNEVGNEVNLPATQPAERNNGSHLLVESTSIEDQLLEEFLKNESVQNNTSELTAEDVDLIEILWKQDVDLGVPRDVFSVSTSSSSEEQINATLDEKQHLEKEVFGKYAKKPESQVPENETKLVDNLENPLEGLSYVIDNETGEYILQDVGSSESTNDPVEETNSAARLSLDQALSLFEFDSEDFSEDKLTDNDFNLGTVDPDGETLEPELESSSLSLSEDFDEVNLALGLYQTSKEEEECEKKEEREEIDENLVNFDEDVALESISEDLEAQLEELMQNFESDNAQSGLSLVRSASMEQRWNDLASFLNLSTSEGSSPVAAFSYDVAASYGEAPVSSYQSNALHSSVMDISGNGSYPNPSLEATMTLGSALSTSLNVTNSTELLPSTGLGFLSLRNTAVPSGYYLGNTADLNNCTEGFFSSSLVDEDMQLMDLAVNDSSFPVRSANGHDGFFNHGIAVPIGAITAAVADTASDSAVSSMGSERVPSISESDWIDTNASDSNIDPAQSSTSYGMDYHSGSKLRPYNFTFSLDTLEGEPRSVASPAASTVQKKHHMFGRRQPQDSTPSYRPDSLLGGANGAATPLLPAEPMGKLEEYGAVGGSFYPDTPGSNDGIPVPALELVRHNHTYPLRTDSGASQRPLARDKPKSSGTRKSAGTSSNSSSGSESEVYSRDVKRARALNIPISVEDIVNLPMDEFSERLTKFELSETQLSLIRDIRRRGKNKVAAQNCRKRKMDQINSLADEVKKVRDKKIRLLKERDALLAEKTRVKNKFTQLYRHIFQSLRDASGQPYSSAEFSLQQSADGSILLVPRAAAHGTTPIDPEVVNFNLNENSANLNLGARRKTNNKK